MENIIEVVAKYVLKHSSAEVVTKHVLKYSSTEVVTKYVLKHSSTEVVTKYALKHSSARWLTLKYVVLSEICCLILVVGRYLRVFFKVFI